MITDRKFDSACTCLGGPGGEGFTENQRSCLADRYACFGLGQGLTLTAHSSRCEATYSTPLAAMGVE